MMRSIILYAPNVGGGGGLVLLRELLKVDWGEFTFRAILDRRGQSSVVKEADGLDVLWVDSSIWGRFRAERTLSVLAARGDIVLCFHNLPPILPNRGFVVCYLQNAYLVELTLKAYLRGWVRTRYALERFIARSFRRRVRRYFVQTPTMAEALARWYGPCSPPIEVVPFAGPLTRQSIATDRRWDFLYISDGSFHKNHRRLFAAWRALAEQGLHPSLMVTLDPGRDAALCAELQDIVATYGAKIENVGQLPHDQVLAAYRQAGALIFPSYMESFGIPLIEAQAANLPILAPELDYVRDVCTPVETFDALSSRSIARAVTRFFGRPSDEVTLLTGQDFADRLRIIGT